MQLFVTMEYLCVCRSVCVCVSGHMLSHRRLPVLSLASGSVCVGRDSERGREITVAIANFKVSTGVVPGQHVYTGELVLGHTHTHTHTPCACTCVDTPYLLFWLLNIPTHNTHTAQSALVLSVVPVS